ncbi:MAG: O-antigen ligase family protein [Patulibacter minatonensis]
MSLKMVGLAAVGGGYVLLAIARPGVALALLAIVLLVFEDDENAVLRLAPLYEPAPLGFSAPMAMVLVCWFGVALQGRARLGPLRGPALVVTSGALAGFLVGHYAGNGRNDMIHTLAPIPVLFAGAAAAAGWIGDDLRRLRRAVVFVASLVAARAVFSLGIFLASDEGTKILQRGDDLVLTSYDPTTNWSLAVLCLGVIAAVGTKVVRRISSRSLLLVVGLIAGATLYYSLRRSFLIGVTLGLVVAVLLLVRRYPATRAILGAVLAAAVLAFASGAVSVAGLGGESTFVQDRAAGDAYRNEERANVLQNIRHAPVFGIGVKSEWQRYGPVQDIGAFTYVHFSFLWQWLYFGLLGAIGYVWMYAVAIRSAARGWSAGAEPIVRLVGVVGVAAVVTLLFADLTASFTFTDPRFSTLLGLVLGTLIALPRIATR